MSDLSLMLPPIAEDLDARDEHQIVQDQWAWWTRVRNSHTTYVNDAIRLEKFYIGDQWESTDAAKLAAEGRPALTINMILSIVDAVLGDHAAKRASVAFEAARGGTESLSAVLSKMWLDIARINDFDHEESQVVSDGLIQRRGWWDVRMEYDTSLRGTVRVQAIDPLEVIIDTDGKKYDPTTWGYVGRTWWASLNDLRTDFNLSAEQVSTLMSLCETGEFGQDALTYAYNTFGGTTMYTSYAGSEEESSKALRKRYRVLEREYKVRCEVLTFVDPLTGDKRRVPEGWDAARAQAFATQNQCILHRSVENRIRWTVTTGIIVLHDAWSPYRTFTKRPYFPYFRRGKPFGLVDNLVSPQEQLNKIASQELHVINTTANSGWMVPAGSLTNMTTDELKAHGAQTGVVLEYNKTKGAPEKIQPNQIPAALDRAEQKALGNIIRIGGVDPSQQTPDPAKTMTGNPLQALHDKTSNQNQVIMENLAYSRKLLMRKVIEVIQDFCTQEQIVYMTVDKDQPQEVIVNEINAAGEVVNNLSCGEYDAVITMVPSRTTFRAEQFIEAAAMMQSGVQIRPERLVALSGLEDRAQIAKEVAQDAGRGELTPEQQQAQQIQAQMQMQQMQLQLEQLNALVQKLQTEAQLNVAKANAAEVMAEAAQSQIEADVQMNRDTNDLRHNLAQLNSATRLDQATIQAQTRAALQENKQDHDIRKLHLTAQDKLHMEHSKQTAELHALVTEAAHDAEALRQQHAHEISAQVFDTHAAQHAQEQQQAHDVNLSALTAPPAAGPVAEEQ